MAVQRLTRTWLYMIETVALFLANSTTKQQKPDHILTNKEAATHRCGQVAPTQSSPWRAPIYTNLEGRRAENPHQGDLDAHLDQLRRLLRASGPCGAPAHGRRRAAHVGRRERSGSRRAAATLQPPHSGLDPLELFLCVRLVATAAKLAEAARLRKLPR
eukprot:CAMPEP_0176064538 /NCGR_PEP_ID=MMETSP0120_2-20121206/32189_1 /TAXON_ID=160619 /ORGANISM="Kryptoperidinium foliaceum, Strain CCMP 1326" /LENGTH=158 /DNA_ID=CAMNT_0017398111 /DNA_START=122 /DNA_END=596 /DNA_ORIENTATION=+